MMFGEKSIIASKTIWGAIVAFFAPYLGTKGITIAADAAGTLNDILGFLGLIYAIYGRLTATQNIRAARVIKEIRQ